jgi:hypothetical protein
VIPSDHKRDKEVHEPLTEPSSPSQSENKYTLAEENKYLEPNNTRLAYLRLELEAQKDNKQ